MKDGWSTLAPTGYGGFIGMKRQGVHDPYMFMDRGMAMPDGQPHLLKERRHVPQEDAETIWRNLKSMGWKRSEPLWGASAEP